MKWDDPGTLLALFVTAGALCLVGSISMGWERVDVRVEDAHESQQAFIQRVDREFDRLEGLYQSHLRRLCSVKDPGNTRAIQELGTKTAGVLQLSFLSLSATSRTNVHLLIKEGADEESVPVPAFEEVGLPLGRPSVIVDSARITDSEANEGWIDDPGKPLFYWYRREDRRMAMVLVEAPSVAAAMDQWLVDWLPAAYEPVDLLESSNLLEAPSGKVLAGEGHASQPHFLLPLPTRFGVWRLASWDAMRTVTHVRWPVLLAGSFLTMAFLGLGALVFGAQRRAARLAQTRVSFVNQVSHELRSPLTNILLNTDLIEDALDEESVSAKRRLRLVQDEAHRLGRLIANVLTFSKRESGRQQVERSPVNVDEVITEVLEQFASSLERLEVEVKHHRGVSQPALLDHDAVFQIVANLVSNVEKYAAEGKLLEIRTAMEGTRLSLEVSDGGPGIATKDTERVFEAFERLREHVGEGATGTGLGLSIARGLAEDLGGSLILEEAGNTGAHFKLELPLIEAGKPHLS